MTEHVASRTLVKSPPELWAECSSAQSLARHLGQFGEIRITRLEPETAVAWEGEDVCGTVRLEPSGWGTKVVLTARPLGPETQPEPGPAPASVPPAAAAGAGHVDPPAAERSMPIVEPPPEYPPAAEPRPHDPPDEPPRAERVASPPRRRWLARLRRWFRRPPVTEDDVPTAVTEQSATAPAATEPPPPPAVTEPPFAAREPETASPPPPGEAQPAPQPVTPMPEPELIQGQSQHETVPGQTEVASGLNPEPGLDPEPALAAALDSLGQAHRRPFSRS